MNTNIVDYFELKDIPEYNGKYKANRNGDIWSCRVKRFMNFSVDPCGYYIVVLCGVTKRVHRLIGKTFLNNENDYPLIDHINQDKKNNHINNLRFVPYWVNNLNRNSKGVYEKPNGKYISLCCNQFLGTFDNYDEAKTCYENKKYELLKPFEKNIL